MMIRKRPPVRAVLSQYFKHGAGDRDRTGTGRWFTRGILSPLRLPVPPLRHKNGGDTRIRTGDKGFAVLCLTTWLCRLKMERKTGFEPATLALARRCSTTEPLPHIWCRDPESNWGHADFQSAALPTELSRQKMAELTGIEPAISGVTGRHVNRYTTAPLAGSVYTNAPKKSTARRNS